MRKIIVIILVIGVFLELFLEYFHRIAAMTQDLGRHLLTGKIIVQTHIVPKENLFSYTYPHFPFINHHWLSEVIFYLITMLFGLHGLLILTTIIVLAAFALLFVSIKKTNIFAAIIVSLLYIPLLFERTDIRPEIFSFLFTALFVVILYQFRKNSTKWIFLLPFMQLLWTNMHIYFIIGILLVGLFLADAIIVGRKNISSQHIRQLLLIFVACGLITLVNPNGITGALYPFHVFQNYGYSVEENQNIFFLQFHYPRASIIYFEIAVISMLFCLIFVLKRAKPVDWFILIVFTILGITAVRNFSLFVFATFIPFVRNFSYITNAVERTIPPKKKIIAGSLFCVLFFSILILQISHIVKNRAIGFGEEVGASKAIDFFIGHHVKGPIFNNFDIGSYIEYRLYPREKVFVDGRPEAYPAKFFQHIYIPMQQDKDMFTLAETNYKFNVIVFSYTDITPWANRFLQLISHNDTWKIVYLDDFIVMLVKNKDNNSDLIQKFGMDEDHVRITHLHSDDSQSLMHLAYFFNTIGWSKQEENMYSKILAIDDNNCIALYNVSILYYRTNNPAKDIFLKKAQITCPQNFK